MSSMQSGALLLLALLAMADADSFLGDFSLGGRRLGGGCSWWCFWQWCGCPAPTPAPTPPPTPPPPQCAPSCSNPCPSDFTYNEDCAYWWQFWKVDTTWCEPKRMPAGAVDADADLEIRGSCDYWLWANGEGKFGSEP